MQISAASSNRWAWCFFLVLAMAAAFPLLTLPRFVMLWGPLAALYLPLKTLFLMVTALTGAYAGYLLIYGRGEEHRKPQVPAPVPDALTLGWSPTADWMRLNNRALQHHTLVLGASGSGKTQLLLSLLAQQIQRGGGVLMIDAKVDKNALLTIRSLCKAADRTEDLRILWPPDPTRSHTWNPLLRGNIEEVLTRIMALWGTAKGGEADFWRGSAHTAIHAVLGAMIKCNKLVTFNDLYLALTSADALLWLERTCPRNCEQHSALTAFLANFRTNKGQLNVDHMKKLIGGVPQYLSAYAWGDLGALMNHTGPSLDMLKALLDGQIVYVALPILARTEEATALARMVIADLKQAVGTLQQRMDRPRIPFLVLMDEASAYMNVDGVERLFEQARSAGVGLVAAAQVVSGFASVDKSRQDFIFGNTASKIIMKLGDFPSAETMAKTVGEELAVFHSKTIGTNKGRQSAWVSPVPNRSSKGVSESEGVKEGYDYIIRPEQFMHQKTGQAVVYIQDPAHGPTLVADAQLVYLNEPPIAQEVLPVIPRNNPPGLDLLATLPQGTISPPEDIQAGPRRSPKPRRTRPPATRRRDGQDFTVIEPDVRRAPAAVEDDEAAEAE